MKQFSFVPPVVVSVAALVLAGCQSSSNFPYKNAKLPAEERVKDLLSRMSLEEKVDMLAGSGWMETKANARLGIPSIKMADGPMGVRSWLGSSAITNAQPQPVLSTSFPSSAALGAAWNPELVEQEGRAIAQQTKAHGRDMILAPTVNINRIPIWGRNFEGYGEDPYLSGRMGVAYIKGVQGEGVIPSLKHYAANNQEWERHRIDEKIDERTLQEIYLPAFKAGVQEAGVWAVMSSYNKVNGTYAAEHPYLLTGVLKKQWGFKGFVISDWGSTYSTVGTVNAGMDLEMPGGEPMKRWFAMPKTKESGNGAGWLTPDKVLPEVKAGRISQATIDDNVGRMLRVMFLAGLFDKPHVAAADGKVETPEHKAVARAAATQGMVLLKNDGNVLPLDSAKLKSIAVIGPAAGTLYTGGGGSSLVRPVATVTPVDGIRQRAGSGVQVNYALGVSMEGDDPAKDTPAEQAKLRDEAVAAAAKADAAIVVVGYSFKLEAEGFDRKSMDLPSGQDALIQAVVKANKKTIVVINSGSPISMSKWMAQVPGILDMWFPGEEGGNAVADILFGVANPSGKLPVTWVRELKDSPAFATYPGSNDFHTEYKEGIYVGYRHFDRGGVAPLFPFGYGLSYTKFDYRDLKVSPNKVAANGNVEVSVTVRNSGAREGAEVVQLYVHDVKSSVDRPVKELKGFRRINLKPGESQTVNFTLDKSAMSFYSLAQKDWVAEPGAFEVLVGASSKDIRLKGGFELQ